jgi:hypothetical protein
LRQKSGVLIQKPMFVVVGAKNADILAIFRVIIFYKIIASVPGRRELFTYLSSDSKENLENEKLAYYLTKKSPNHLKSLEVIGRF